jgi:UDP-4-amino-4,6-dideoxy-N-acetyl-beta-L-altrosamine N-acetyltransferase
MQIKEGCLRPMEDSDLQQVLDWRNSERVRLCMRNQHIISPEEHAKWWAGLNWDRHVPLIFEYRGRPVGVVNVTQIDWQSGTCEWGFYLGEENMPRGTGRLMGYEGLRFIFEVMGLRKINSEVLTSNKKSLDYHYSLGFVIEGTLHDQIKLADRYVGLVLMASFKNRWLLTKPVLRASVEGAA